MPPVGICTRCLVRENRHNAAVVYGKTDAAFSHFDTVHKCNGQKDGRTDKTRSAPAVERTPPCHTEIGAVSLYGVHFHHSNCIVKTKFHCAILLVNELASGFASGLVHELLRDLLASWNLAYHTLSSSLASS